MGRGLQARLTTSFLAIILITATLVMGLTNFITTDRFTYMISASGQMRAQRLATAVAETYARTGSWAAVEQMLIQTRVSDGAMMMPGHGGPAWMRPDSAGGPDPILDGGERILVFSPEGKVLADSDQTEATPHFTAAQLRKGAPIVVAGEKVGVLVIASALGRLTELQSSFLRQVNLLVLAAASLAVLAGLLISRVQTQRIVAPVKALAEASRRIAAGDFSQRLPVEGEDELAEMAQSFNTMAAQLAQQHELRRRATADIAHELRTPLTVLQIDLESLEDGLLTSSPEVIAGLQTEVKHLERLVEDLRLLSLAEAGELPLMRQPLEVGALVRETATRVQGTARERGITLETRTPETPLPIQGDAQRLAQVLLNLLTNALYYTPGGGHVSVAAAADADRAHITVSDSGPGIAPADLPYIFERFYRADRARSRETGGSGLGLAIARSLVEAHGGRIWAESTGVKDAGSVFHITLPLDTEKA